MIGMCGNIPRQMNRISPDEIIETLKLDEPAAFLARLLRKYKTQRLPESGYFKFSSKELSECQKQFDLNSKIPKTIGADFKIAFIVSSILCLINLIVLLKLGIGLALTLTLSLLSASFPMWLLFFLGNFGGYDCSDLTLFSSWSNRIRALLVALLLSILSYLNFRYSHVGF